MRKIKLLSHALVVGFSALALSSSVYAVELASGTPVTTGDCSVLTADVTVNLSKNVVAGYICRTADATATPQTINRVGLGTCNTGGTAKSRSVTCSRVSDGATPPVYTYTPTTCSSGNFDATSGTVLPLTAGQVAVNGVAIYTTSTSGGTIGEDGMASTLCNGAGISGLVEAAYP